MATDRPPYVILTDSSALPDYIPPFAPPLAFDATHTHTCSSLHLGLGSKALNDVVPRECE